MSKVKRKLSAVFEGAVELFGVKRRKGKTFLSVIAQSFIYLCKLIRRSFAATQSRIVSRNTIFDVVHDGSINGNDFQ